MKYFLLIAGDQYYPSSGTSDWIDTFPSNEEAESAVEKNGETYKIRGSNYDWYYVINLQEWIEK